MAKKKQTLAEVEFERLNAAVREGLHSESISNERADEMIALALTCAPLINRLERAECDRFRQKLARVVAKRVGNDCTRTDANLDDIYGAFRPRV